MKLVLTVMVRDEADIIEAMIEHHLSQGVDLIIATDNGSVDGTREILESYRDTGRLILHHDPVHMKQQYSTVTTMAREAYTDHGADWVINADADEFWLPVNSAVTLHEAFSHIPQALQAFLVPVTDMTGLAASSGSQLGRLNLRDGRSDEELIATGLLAHSTPDAAHIGSATVEVAQGNHFVSLRSCGDPDPDWAIEVLHLPWRSWEQYRRKVDNAGRAYEASSNLSPSPNHHGMRDYRRLKEGVLLPFYLLRHPTQIEIDIGVEDGTYVVENRLSTLESRSVPDVMFEPSSENRNRQMGAAIASSEARQRTLEMQIEKLEASAAETASTAIEDARSRAALERRIVDCNTQILVLEDTQAELEEFAALLRARHVVRLADEVSGLKSRINNVISRIVKS